MLHPLLKRFTLAKFLLVEYSFKRCTTFSTYEHFQSYRLNLGKKVWTILLFTWSNLRKWQHRKWGGLITSEFKHAHHVVLKWYRDTVQSPINYLPVWGIAKDIICVIKWFTYFFRIPFGVCKILAWKNSPQPYNPKGKETLCRFKLSSWRGGTTHSVICWR